MFLFLKRTTCRHLRMGIRSHITGLPFQRPLLDTTADGYVYLRHDSLNLFLNHRTKEGVRESRPCFLLGSYPSHLRAMKISSVFQDFQENTWPHTAAALVDVQDDLNYCTCHKGLRGTVNCNTVFYPLNRKDVTFIQADLTYQCHIKISVFISIVSFLTIKWVHMHDGDDILFVFYFFFFTENIQKRIHSPINSPCCLLMKFILLHFNVKDKIILYYQTGTQYLYIFSICPYIKQPLLCLNVDD